MSKIKQFGQSRAASACWRCHLNSLLPIFKCVFLQIHLDAIKTPNALGYMCACVPLYKMKISTLIYNFGLHSNFLFWRYTILAAEYNQQVMFLLWAQYLYILVSTFIIFFKAIKFYSSSTSECLKLIYLTFSSWVFSLAWRRRFILDFYLIKDASVLVAIKHIFKQFPFIWSPSLLARALIPLNFHKVKMK